MEIIIKKLLINTVNKLTVLYLNSDILMTRHVEFHFNELTNMK